MSNNGNGNGHIYTPSERDVRWTEALLNTINDGGMWMVPANAAAYQIHKIEKKMALIAGPKDELYFRIKAVLAVLGWTLSDERPETSAEGMMGNPPFSPDGHL